MHGVVKVKRGEDTNGGFVFSCNIDRIVFTFSIRLYTFFATDTHSGSCFLFSFRMRNDICICLSHLTQLSQTTFGKLISARFDCTWVNRIMCGRAVFDCEWFQEFQMHRNKTLTTQSNHSENTISVRFFRCEYLLIGVFYFMFCWNCLSSLFR